MTIHFGRPDLLGTIAETVPLYGGREFESPTRSTIPMLSLLIYAPETFAEIVGQLGMPDGCDLFLEYTFRPPKGRGKASHTDVMLKSGADALAIEAKWTEPLYPSVENWLKAGKDRANRTAVLEGWLGFLRKRTTQALVAGDFAPVIYQMLHRAASAAATGESPRLAYFLFEPSPDDRAARPNEVFESLSVLWNNLGKPERFPFYVVEIEARPLEAYEALRPLPKGQATSEIVSAALQDSAPLFRFESFSCRQVGAEP